MGVSLISKSQIGRRKEKRGFVWKGEKKCRKSHVLRLLSGSCCCSFFELRRRLDPDSYPKFAPCGPKRQGANVSVLPSDMGICFGSRPLPEMGIRFLNSGLVG
jgi:hypothetical protein